MTRPEEYSHEQKLKAVLRLSQLIGTSPRLVDVLEGAMNALEEFLQARDSSVYEVDYEAGELFFRHARGEKADELMTRRLAIGEGVAGHVAADGRPVIVNRAEEDERFSDRFDRELGYETRSMLAVPLSVKGRVIGVVQLLNKRDGGDFDQADVELAQIMAGPIAYAIENAKLYGRLEEKQQRTEEELRRTQERLIRSERQAALSGLAHGIAHQIRNPAMSIGGFARLILEKTSPEQENIKKYAQVIIEENGRLEQLVRQVRFLIDMAPNPVPSDIPALIDRAVETRTVSAKGLAVEVEPLAGLPPVTCDPDLVVTALDEVLRNAAEAGAGHVIIRAGVEGDHLYIEVEDDGEGFQPESLAAALDPFYSSRAHNLGLGLAVVHRIFKENGGDVDLGRNEGPGARVRMTLPLIAPEL